MAFKINKGCDLGKFYYQNSGVTYGPLPIDELLNRINGDTLVYYDGVSWDKAKNIPDLQKFFIPSQNNESINYTTSSNDVLVEKKSRSSAIFFVILFGLIAIVAYLFYNEKSKSELANSDIYADSTLAVGSDSSINVEDALYKALSTSQIIDNQLQRLNYSDVLLYQNELLARHKFIFEDQSVGDYYRSKTWYSPENDYLVATAGFSEIEKYNFSLLENKKNEIGDLVRDFIKRYYSSFTDNSFDATSFYAERVNKYITQSNITSHRINELYGSESKDYVNPKFKFSDPIELTYEKGSNGISYFYFMVYYGVFRPSKNKYQTCLVKIKMGLDMNYKLVHYEQAGIENLKFSDYDEFDSLETSTNNEIGTWMVILGSFSTESDAYQLQNTLKDAGIDSEVLNTNNFQNLSKNLFIVCGGKELIKEEASKIAYDISAQGYQAYIKDAGTIQ
jgi:hypothetical protein